MAIFRVHRCLRVGFVDNELRLALLLEHQRVDVEIRMVEYTLFFFGNAKRFTLIAIIAGRNGRENIIFEAFPSLLLFHLLDEIMV